MSIENDRSLFVAASNVPVPVGTKPPTQFAPASKSNVNGTGPGTVERRLPGGVVLLERDQSVVDVAEPVHPVGPDVLEDGEGEEGRAVSQRQSNS